MVAREFLARKEVCLARIPDWAYGDVSPYGIVTKYGFAWTHEGGCVWKEEARQSWGLTGSEVGRRSSIG